MKLAEIAAGSPAVALDRIGLYPALVLEIQTRLAALGLLDPPADGRFGPVSRWALQTFLSRAVPDASDAVDQRGATAMLASDAERHFPLVAGTDLAGRIIQAMLKRGDWIQRAPECINIVYVEAMSPDGMKNDNAPNAFNDLRVAVEIAAGGVPKIAGAWEGTTEPGRYWTDHPMDPKGAARIGFGQYKSWAVGMHHAGGPGAHEALVQVAPVTVYRDLNKDYQRRGDAPDKGLFGINQHWGYDLPKNDLGRSSAGCLVGRSKVGHIAFKALLRNDPRYRASHSYNFMSSVFAADEIP